MFSALFNNSYKAPVKALIWMKVEDHQSEVSRELQFNSSSDVMKRLLSDKKINSISWLHIKGA